MKQEFSHELYRLVRLLQSAKFDLCIETIGDNGIREEGREQLKASLTTNLKVMLLGLLDPSIQRLQRKSRQQMLVLQIKVRQVGATGL